MSTENTRAPSFANNAANGRPTTSDLVKFSSLSHEHQPNHPAASTWGYHSPINNSHSLPIRAIAIRQYLIIHPNIFQTFHDGERRAGEDGLDVAGGWRVGCGGGSWGGYGGVGGGGGGGGWGGEEGAGVDVADAGRGLVSVSG